ncbi:hypothetical protein HY624_04120, partial [Candidatus Uhrbacteria bacterium]|nr:hypothetical protein [Candidatus Uhrbacteria bacterium]
MYEIDGIPLSLRLSWFFQHLDRDEMIALSIVVFLFIILPLWYAVRWFLRRRAMMQLARDLGCRYTKRRYEEGSSWSNQRRKRFNIIEGTWRGKQVLIYDMREWDGGEDIEMYTVINGKNYYGINFLWMYFSRLPVRKIRRVLNNDPTILPVEEDNYDFAGDQTIPEAQTALQLLGATRVAASV